MYKIITTTKYFIVRNDPNSKKHYYIGMDGIRFVSVTSLVHATFFTTIKSAEKVLRVLMGDGYFVEERHFIN